MKKLFPAVLRSSRRRPLKTISAQEHGLTLVMALMLGMVLMTGVSGLLARQLMSRRLSAKESYQQMAEAAANNGLWTAKSFGLYTW